MMHHPEEHFPPHVKTVLMSQSDFQLPAVNPKTLDQTKIYDFTYVTNSPHPLRFSKGVGAPHQ